METVDLYPGIVYKLPPKPKKEAIKNWDLPKKEQRWTRFVAPDVTFADGVKENLVNLGVDVVNALFEAGHPEVLKFIEQDNARCTDGTWFYNNGVPTYITGDHYELLQWFKMDIGYPFYEDKDRRWYYFEDFCEKDPDCMGSLYGKKRRDGFSYRAMSRVLKHARRSFDSNYGMMSKTGEDAKQLFQKLINAFKHYPAFYKPQVFNMEDAQKELVFKEPAQRATRKNPVVRHGVSLNTRIDYRNTRDNSYDGSKLKRLVGDEIAKGEEFNFEKWLAVVTTCLTQGRKIIGKFIGGSSVEEVLKGGEEFKTVWNKSDPLKKEAVGRTLSGLYRYFTPASDGLEGFIDEYGNSVIETPDKPVMGIDGELIAMGALPYLLERRRAKKEAGDMVGYYEECRQYPLNEDDMFLDPQNETTLLPIEKIYQQIEFNNSFVKMPLRQGNFIWENGQRDTSVIFVDDPHGKWLVYWFPKPEDRNKKVHIGGYSSPGNKDLGLFSLDPYDHKLTTKNRASNAASHGYRKFDIVDTPNSDMFISEYIARPTDPYTMYEDMIMQCVFYGWQILGESNKPGCMNYFQGRGYGNYLMPRPIETQVEWSEKRGDENELWVPTTGEKVRNSLVGHLQAWIYQHVGILEDGKCGKMFFNRTLYDWREAKLDQRWTDYDPTVSSMLAIVGSLAYTPKKRAETRIQAFPMYKYNGSKAELIDPTTKPQEPPSWLTGEGPSVVAGQ